MSLCQSADDKNLNWFLFKQFISKLKIDKV